VFVYAALGDSITFGQNASSIEKTYPSRIISSLYAQGVQAKRIVLARPGWTSADLAEAIHTDPYPLRFINTVSVWIGGDDLIRYGLPALQRSGKSMEGMFHQFGRRLDAVLGFLRATGVHTIICCTQYNPFPNSLIAVQAIGRLNQAIAESAVKNGCLVARVDQWFSGSEPHLIDGYRSGNIEEALRGFAAVHPNDQGHQVIAAGLFPIVYSQSRR
jgi:lysophospholipase L1-like esterase